MGVVCIFFFSKKELTYLDFKSFKIPMGHILFKSFKVPTGHILFVVWPESKNDLSSNIILKLSRSKLKFYKHGIGIESVICNLHMFGVSCCRAKVTQNENLLMILQICLVWLHRIFI